MQIIEGNALAKLCDYNFGDHHAVWDNTLTGSYEPANLSNFKFIGECKKFEGKAMTLFIDNIRLYNRELEFNGSTAETDSQLIKHLMHHNDLLKLCKLFPDNKFIIFTSNEDTALDDTIQVPDNVLAIYAVNGYSIHPKVHPFPIGLQRIRGQNDNRLAIMEQRVLEDERIEPSKLLYINCGIERNPERAPLAHFHTSDWITARFDKDSMFFPYSAYNTFLDELQNHKFVVCPKGQKRGKLDCFDTHRLWETLYMRRVPVILEHPYFRRLLKDFPILYVKDWNDITEELLTINDYLYLSAQTMDMNKLDLDKLYNNYAN